MFAIKSINIYKILIKNIVYVKINYKVKHKRWEFILQKRGEMICKKEMKIILNTFES